jgi:hypothetical protein
VGTDLSKIPVNVISISWYSRYSLVSWRSTQWSNIIVFWYDVLLGVIRWQDFYHFNIVHYNEDYNVNIGNESWMSQLCTYLLSTMWQLMLHHWLAESQAVFWQGKLSTVPQKPYCQPSEKTIKDGYYHTQILVQEWYNTFMKDLNCCSFVCT